MASPQQRLIPWQLRRLLADGGEALEFLLKEACCVRLMCDEAGYGVSLAS